MGLGFFFPNRSDDDCGRGGKKSVAPGFGPVDEGGDIPTDRAILELPA